MDAKQVQGLSNFVTRCDGIERRVPNLSSVVHWVQKPETIFNQVVAKAQTDTGLNLINANGQPSGGGGLLAGVNLNVGSLMGGAFAGEEQPVATDAELGLQPIGGNES